MTRILARVREPRVERCVMFAVYLLTLVMGASALVTPPQIIEGAIGQTLTVIWGGLLVVCGAFGASGVMPGLWWAERVAVRAGMTGAAIHAAVLISHNTREAGNLIPWACAVVIVALVFVGRAHKIRGVNYEPRPDRR